MSRRLSNSEVKVLQASANGNTWQLRSTGRYAIKIRGQRESTVNHAAQTLVVGGLIRTVPAPHVQGVNVWDHVVPTDLGLLALARALEQAERDRIDAEVERVLQDMAHLDCEVTS